MMQLLFESGSRLQVNRMKAMAPKLGDKIMIFKDKWASLILSGQKKLEVRSKPYKEGSYWIGCKQKILGKCTLEKPLQIKTKSEWKQLQSLHCCEIDELPYKNTWVFQISNVEVSPEMTYKHPKGAVSIVRYHP